MKRFSLICLAIAFAMVGCKAKPAADANKPEPKVTQLDAADVPSADAGAAVAAADAAAPAAAATAEPGSMKALFMKCDTCFANPHEICFCNPESGDCGDNACDLNAIRELSRDGDKLIAFFDENESALIKYNRFLAKFSFCNEFKDVDEEEAEDEVEAEAAADVAAEEEAAPSDFEAFCTQNAPLQELLSLLKNEYDHAKWLKENNRSDRNRALWHFIDRANRYYLDHIVSILADADDPDNAEALAKAAKGLEDTHNRLNEIIKSGADINASNWDGKTPLFEIYDKDLILALIKDGADVKVKDVRGNTLLHRFRDDAEMTDALVKAGADINAKNDEGSTPVFYITNVDALNKYKELGADLKVSDAHGNTLLHKEGVSAAMLEALLAAGLDINAKNDEGRTPIFFASDDVLQAFIDHGADVKVADSQGNSLLHRPHLTAARIQTLTAAGLDANSKNAKGEGPILGCIVDSDIDSPDEIPTVDKDCIDALKAAGADIHAADNDGNNLLSRMFILGTTKDTYKMLLDMGYSASAIAPNFMTELTNAFYGYSRAWRFNPKSDSAAHAIYAGYDSLIPTLIGAGLDINKRDLHNNTLLFFTESAESAKALIDAGLDVNARNNDGETAINFHTDWSRLPAITAMVEAGADVNTRDNRGISALFKNLNSVVVDDDGLRRPILSFAVPDVLLQNAADVNTRDINGRTLLFYTFSDTDLPENYSLTLLTALEADLNAQDADGKTAVMVSENRCALVDAGADLSIRDEFGRNAMFYNHVIDCLIDENGKAKKDVKELVNAADSHGITPLMACRDVDTLKKLIAAGADVNATDAHGRSVIDYYSGSEEFRSALTAAGAVDARAAADAAAAPAADAAAAPAADAGSAN